MGEIVFISAFVATAVIDVVVAIAALRIKERDASFLSAASSAAALVSVTYLISVLASTRLLMSFFSSLYFIGVDLCLIAFSGFVSIYTGAERLRFVKAMRTAMLCYFCLDCVLLLANPFNGGLAVGFTPVEGHSGLYSYEPHLFFTCHLTYCYLMVVFCAVALISKIVRVPRIYRVRYTAVCASFLFIVFCNVLYLFVPDVAIYDYSVLLYGLMAFLLYFMRFRYSERAMLGQARKLVVDQMGHAVVLFDYEERFVTLNSDAAFLVAPNRRNRQLRLGEFVETWGVEDKIGDLGSDASFFWRGFKRDERVSYRVDYRLLRDEKGRVIGYLFILTDNSLEVDLLTGFDTQAAWERDCDFGQVDIDLPCAVAACDLTRLSVINEELGRDAGDEILAWFAGDIRAAFPATARFVRLADANLLVVAPLMSEQEAHGALEEIGKSLSSRSRAGVELSMQSCVAMMVDESQDVSSVVHQSLSGLMARKLLVENSTHASLISSLVQLQRQSDGETEEHVQRTREMGNRLGLRLGLSDSDLNSFALLCLLHDIGKVGVPLEILNKPGKLTPAERAVMQSHAVKGYEIARASKELSGVADYILHHHENWDGSGYPDGLSKDAIPLLSRIVSVVDTFDAMTHDRPYRRAVSVDEAKAELRRCAGTQFDPFITAEFIAMLEENPDIASSDWAPGAAACELERDGARSLAGQGDDALQGAADRVELPQEDGAATVARHHVRYRLDENQRIIEINDEFTRMTGYTEEDLEAYNMTQIELIPLEDRELYQRQVEEGLAANHEVMIEHRLRRKDGTNIYVLCYGREFFDPAAGKLRSEIVAADLRLTESARRLIREAQVSAVRRQEKWEAAMRRDVTGVLTRSAFRNDVQLELMDEASKVLLMIVDLDFFKQYNDTKGHPRGDALLMRLAQLMAKEVGEDGYAGRLGGDEFAMAKVLPADASDEEIARAANLFWQNIESGLVAYDDMHVTMGAAAAKGGNTAYSTLYSEADTALYQAKALGRRRCEVKL